jgi:hypothetical protein
MALFLFGHSGHARVLLGVAMWHFGRCVGHKGWVCWPVWPLASCVVRWRAVACAAVFAHKR